jgi:hypothetical protein
VITRGQWRSVYRHFRLAIECSGRVTHHSYNDQPPGTTSLGDCLRMGPVESRSFHRRGSLGRGRKAGHARGAPGPVFAYCRGGETVTGFEISFPLHFQSFQVPGIGILRAPMLTSNRLYARTIKIQRPFRLPSLRTDRPTRHPIHHHGRPNSRQPHLRRRADDPPVCVTKSPTKPATQSRKGTYLHTSITLNSSILRHNSPSPAPGAPTLRCRAGAAGIGDRVGRDGHTGDWRRRVRGGDAPRPYDRLG